MAISLEDIKYFIKTAETLNMTRASELLGISQPALSYSLKRLEDDLNSKLFIRLKNGMKLTKMGEEFYKKSHELIFKWQEVKNIVDPNNVENIGTYKIGFHPSVALFSLKEFWPEIQKQYPNLNFKFEHGLSREMVEKVISWEVDFAIAVNPIQHPDLTIIDLYKDTVTGFAVKNHHHKMIMDQDLHQTQFILKKLGKLNLGFISTNNLEVVLELSSLGAGIGILPESIARKNSRLQKVKNFPQFEDRICLVYRHEKMNHHLGLKILDIIKKSYKKPKN